MKAVPLRAGVHDAVPMHIYVHDPCAEPSVSSGVIKDLTNRSPAHAWSNHPRLGGADDEAGSAANTGSAAHLMLLGGDESIAWIDADSYRTKAAQNAKKEAVASGRIPMLAKDAAPVVAMVKKARKRLQEFGRGVTEQTLIWEDDGAWCRARVDWACSSWRQIIDYKTTTNADPASWIKSVLFSQGYDVQASHYLRGIEKLKGPADRCWIWLVQETKPPYECSLIGASPQLLELADRKVERAMGIWRRCIRENRWPAYSHGIYWAEPPSYHEYEIEERLLAPVFPEAS